MDGTQIKAWARVKSFKAKNGSEGGKPNFKGTKRSNKTHESKSDPDAKLFRKGKGKESMLCHLGTKKKHSALDGRTTKKPSYERSLKRRYLPEPVFDWIKNLGRMR